MKKMLIGAVVLFLVAAANVGANSVTVSRIPGYYAGNGGEFNITPLIGQGYSANALVNGGFETFCVQTSVHIALPGTYNYTTSQTDSQGTALTIGTAWLFEQFALGTLVNYDWSTTLANSQFASRAAAAQALQNTLWELQSQSYDATMASYYLGVVIGQFGSLLNAENPNNCTLPVDIVNLTDANGNPVQNMLTLPDGGVTAMLLGFVLAGFGLVSMRIRSKA